MAAFNNDHRDNVWFDQDAILNDLPVHLANDIAFGLYGECIVVSTHTRHQTVF